MGNGQAHARAATDFCSRQPPGICTRPRSMGNPGKHAGMSERCRCRHGPRSHEGSVARQGAEEDCRAAAKMQWIEAGLLRPALELRGMHPIDIEKPRT